MLTKTAVLVFGFALMALPALAKPAIVNDNGAQRSYAVRCQLVKIVTATGVHWVRRCW